MTRIHGFLAVVLAGWSLLSTASSPPTQVARESQDPSSREIARIQAHLDGALAALRAADTSELTIEQRAARARHVRTLQAYRDRGAFPHNHDFPGRFVPYFADDHGTLCAVGYLAHSSGRDDIVRLVAENQNHASVTELAADPEIGPVLADWLDGAGLTVAEAQRIQPSYYVAPPTDEDPDEVSASYGAATAVATTFNLGATGVSTSYLLGGSGERWLSTVGLVSGTLGIYLGMQHLDADGTAQALSIGNLALGLTTVVTSTWALARGGEAKHEPEAASPQGVRVDPVALLGSTNEPMAGIRVRF